jgi:hypothetical protein
MPYSCYSAVRAPIFFSVKTKVGKAFDQLWLNRFSGLGDTLSAECGIPECSRRASQEFWSSLPATAYRLRIVK